MRAQGRSGVSIALAVTIWDYARVLRWLLSSLLRAFICTAEPCSDFSEQGFFDELLFPQECSLLIPGIYRL